MILITDPDSQSSLISVGTDQVNVKDLVDLTSLASDREGAVNSGMLPGVYPSCGGCDEFMRFYACRKIMKLVRPATMPWTPMRLSCG